MGAPGTPVGKPVSQGRLVVVTVACGAWEQLRGLPGPASLLLCRAPCWPAGSVFQGVSCSPKQSHNPGAKDLGPPPFQGVWDIGAQEVQKELHHDACTPFPLC